MNTGKSIPVWFTEEDRRRVEEAAALAGYRHLSKYIRDKALSREGQREAARDSMRVGRDSLISQASDMAEDFLVSDRGRRGITEPIRISPRSVTKKPFVLSRSAGGDHYGH